MIYKWIIISSILLIISCEITFEEYLSWDDNFSVIFNETTIKNYALLPNKIRFSKNGTLWANFPRIYNDQDTTPKFLSLNKLDNNIFWNFGPWNYQNFYSIGGFFIDSEDNFYLLDQGVIDDKNNYTIKSTSKLFIFSKDGNLTNITNLNENKDTPSLLTDIVVDPDGKYAYILDSGNLLNSTSIPKIIRVDIFNNKFDEASIQIETSNFESNPSDEDYFSKITGFNSLSMSCDGEFLYLSSSKDNHIYMIKKSDIKQNEDGKENIVQAQKINTNIKSQSIFISSKNNLYLTNKEEGKVRILYDIEEDLESYNFNDYYEINSKNSKISYPISMDINNASLFLLDIELYNQTENKRKFTLYKASLADDEFSFKNKCTIFIFKMGFFIGVYFVFITIILILNLLIIFANHENKNVSKSQQFSEDAQNMEDIKENLFNN